MPTNFFSTDPAPQPEPPKEAPKNENPEVTVGDKSYSQDELAVLVGLGTKAQEIEKNHGSLDKFVAESGRRADEIGRYKKQVADLEAAAQPVAPGKLSPEQMAQVRTGLYEILGGEPLTQGNATKWYVAMRDGEKLIEECDSLAEEINGGDGRPKFDRDEIINYMAETGIKKPLLAYKDKYEDSLKSWDSAQLAKKPKAPAPTLEANGEVREPAPVRPNKDNINQLITEALGGVQE